MANIALVSPAEAAARSGEDAVYGKVLGRIVPLLFLAYIVSYLDRVNIGFAKAQMMRDVGLIDQNFALGARRAELSMPSMSTRREH
jgi:sugar phosphate permease